MLLKWNTHLRQVASVAAMAAALATSLAAPTRAATPTLTIDAGHPAGSVSPLMYGLMTEEINHAYDGGLYGELLRNRSFMDSTQEPSKWSVVQDGGASATMALDPSQALNEDLTTSLRVDVAQASAHAPAGIANSGYWGIPVFPGTSYHASFYAKASAGYTGTVTLALQSADGQNTFASTTLTGLSTEWHRFEAVLQTPSTAHTTANARYTLTVDKPGTLWLQVVSLFPPTWNDRPNGLRKDLMQMLVDLHPRFLRLPGGNFVEGGSVATRFQWKRTIGPLANRPGHPSTWGYRASDGMGLLEYLEWCQDMGAEPLLAVFAGYALGGNHIDPGPKLQPFVQEALDEIQYITGDPTTTWGARRAKDGHPDPFPLHYVEIGNEDNFDKSGSYDGRFTQFYDAIKAKYPHLKLVSTIGNEHPLRMRVHSRTPDAVDEHYYRPAQEFIADSNHYEKYARTGGPEIVVGEWASYEDPKIKPWDPAAHRQPPTANMLAALGDATFMTDLERNSDIVTMNCYAPMFVNVNHGAWQWRPDFIGYDALRVFGSPSYHAFKMFSSSIGDQRLAISSADTAVRASATRDSRDGQIYLKLVNPTPTAEQLHVSLKGLASINPTATAITMTADPAATNSIDQPSNVLPVTTTMTNLQPSFVLPVAADTIAVLKINTR